jgi:hypothetical protein
MKRYIIEKQNTTDTNATTTYDDDSEYFTESDYQTSNAKGGAPKVYTSLTKTQYRKPQSGSRQDNLSREMIIQKLENYIPLKTMQDKKILETLPRFKTWIKYYNTQTKQFRTGGLLSKISYPDYIMLINTKQNLTWSVQLKDNVIYIPDPKYVEKIQKEKEKEVMIKEKLFNLYKQGKLAQK